MNKLRNIVDSIAFYGSAYQEKKRCSLYTNAGCDVTNYEMKRRVIPQKSRL